MSQSQAAIQALRQSIPGVNREWGGPEYTNWQDEQLSWKTTCYIGDWSFLMDLELRGPGALQLLSDSSVNSYVTHVEVTWGDPGHPQRRIRATTAPAPYKKDRRRDDLQQL